MGDGYERDDGWTLAVTGVNWDAAADVAAANSFNDPPEPGRKFVLIDLLTSYNGATDPDMFDMSLRAVGDSAIAYWEGCGVLPNNLDTHHNVFAGGILEGQVCFDVEVADVENLALYIRRLSSGDIFFSLSEPSAAPTGVVSHRGPVPGASSTANRTSPVPIGTSADIGDGWSLTVNGVAEDSTSAVLNENMFNDPPPAGHIFMSVHVSMTNTDHEKDTPFGWNLAYLVGDSNIEFDKSCGVTPDPLDWWTDVFLGGTISGNICFVVPTADLTSPLVLSAGREPVFFAAS